MFAKRSVVCVGALVAVFVMVLAGPAIAKGPESVVLTGPGIDEPINLVPDQRSDTFELLLEQTGIWFGTLDPIDAPAVLPDARFTITWVNEGPPSLPTPARTIVQHVYLSEDGRVLIETPNQGSLSGWGQGVIGWFEAPPTFLDTMLNLGVDLEAAAVAPIGVPAADSDSGWLAVAGVVTLLAILVALKQVIAATRSPEVSTG